METEAHEISKIINKNYKEYSKYHYPLSYQILYLWKNFLGRDLETSIILSCLSIKALRIYNRNNKRKSYKDFIKTKEILGSPKYAFIPIGAYDPEWFMSESHVNPENAIKIMEDLEAERSFGMHWGTFTLTAEDTLEPPERLKQALQNSNLENFDILIPGEVIYLN